MFAIGVGGVFGYTFKGIYEEVRKKHGTGIDAQLRAARMKQGFVGAREIPGEQERLIAQRWVELRFAHDPKK
jgi:hypothetical protein